MSTTANAVIERAKEIIAQDMGVGDGSFTANRLAGANLLRQSAPVEDGRVPERECFWLIERKVTPPQYTDSYSPMPGLTSDPWRAFRYKTEREAHEAWRWLATLRDECKVVEHMFINSVSAPASPPADAPHQCPYCPNPDRDSVAVRENGRLLGCQWKEDKRVSIGADPPCVCDNYGTRKGYPREFRSSAASSPPADVAGILTDAEKELLSRSAEFVLAGEWPWKGDGSKDNDALEEAERAALKTASTKICALPIPEPKTDAGDR